MRKMTPSLLYSDLKDQIGLFLLYLKPIVLLDYRLTLDSVKIIKGLDLASLQAGMG